MLVGGIVIHDQMQLFVFGRGIVHEPQEVDPLLMPVPLLAQTDHFSIQSVEGGKQRSRAVALVIVGHGAGPTALPQQAFELGHKELIILLRQLATNVQIAAQVDDLIIRPGGILRHREWGLYEVGICGPDGLLVRIGWPSRLMTKSK